jgi:long-chain acyl-CoA synthetase
MNWRDAEREYTDEVIEMNSLGRMFDDAAERHANRPAQLYKGGVYDRSLTETVVPAAPAGEFRAISYAEMREIVRNLATGFRDLGIDAEDRVGIFANTRMEWAQCDFALLTAGAVVTTVYTSSSESQTRYLLDDPDASAVVVENRELAERVIAVEDDLDLEFVVVMDRVGGAFDHRDDVYTLADVHERGATKVDPEEVDGWLDARDPDDLASLIYTSGTTGRPKGVKLTHRNFRSNVNQIRRRFAPRPDRGPEVPAITPETTSVSYLPLAHVLERTGGHFIMFASGATVGYAEDPDTLQEDFSLVQPTAATSVPRVYEKIYDAIREQASESDLKQRIFEWAVDVGREYNRADSPGIALKAKQTVADRLVFSQVKDALGGNVEFLISGGGSLSPDLAELYHGMGLPILEGYGLTETAPVVTVNPPEEPKIGTIGPAVVDVDLKVDDSIVAEGDFPDAEGEVGELLVKGPNVTDGYWNQPGETRESFTEDGWFRTGDVVEIRPDDYVTFRERSKQIMVLSTGKNVPPGPIEDAFASSEVVEQAMVVGDDEKFVAAIVVPNFDAFAGAETPDGEVLPEDPEALLEHPYVEQAVQAEVDRVNEDFETYEQIKSFRMVPEEFTEENDLLTPTMKKKRRKIHSRYEDLLAEIYQED